MQGNNAFQLNEATIREALEEYFRRRMPGERFQVKSVAQRLDVSSPLFEVVLESLDEEDQSDA